MTHLPRSRGSDPITKITWPIQETAPEELGFMLNYVFL